ncbi:hypothetical protein BGZ65_010836, partial [Modicella reniformis]
QQEQQQIVVILQKTQQMHQRIEHSHQQLRQRIEEDIQKTQLMDQQKQLIDEILQKLKQQDRQAEQSQQQVQQETVQKIQRVDQQQQQQQTEKILKKKQQIDQQVQHSHQQMQPQIDKIQQRVLLQVEATQNMSFQETPVPRLFIVLPNTTATGNEQGKQSSSQFRLYFLCECTSLTMESVTSGAQEIHMPQHPGYNLIKAKKFFEEYGSYLLTMMYMVKYGANADGLKVPPLLGLDLANEVEAGQTCLNFVKKNISRLVNDTNYILKIQLASPTKTQVPLLIRSYPTWIRSN